VHGDENAPDRSFEAGTERGSHASNGLATFSGAESKRQDGNVDLAMVALASL
jgi:hypothetical protein